jgi:hypothetical protein
VVGHGSKYGGATYIYEVSIWLAVPCQCRGTAAGTPVLSLVHGKRKERSSS